MYTIPAARAAAVSLLKMKFPKLTGVNPFSVSRRASSAEKPPSGPTTIFAPFGAGFFSNTSKRLLFPSLSKGKRFKNPLWGSIFSKTIGGKILGGYVPAALL